ncbi:hypothetical protein GGI25_004512 [Coemansia spiralis]|uniref:Rab3 GTPase-activating protein catalytic subunit n=2 Tax=Coemansia TaxID=4863 RepID=A0A9W8G083_9FUNG|nr:hypothetical protein EDC05_004211 [Coemansia umbellata]KAJ2620681.1 hypothetical protein GGI26_004759 [Coemansia sp. RSA 1358]KAJ2673945.1 hypothetical protein GGI25_004512 [Coemansia spiralis]
MAADDDENFELVDYTSASSWEKFVATIEAKLNAWGLGDGGTGDFNLEELASKCQNLIVKHKQYREPVLNQISDLCTKAVHLSYKGIAYAMVLSIHPLIAGNSNVLQTTHASKLAAFNSQFPPVHVPELEIDHSQTEPDPAWHPLHRWTGCRIVIYLRYLGDEHPWDDQSLLESIASSNNVGDYYSVSLETVKFLISSMNIAVQNVRCQVPVFVPVGDAWRCLFTGRSLGRATITQLSGHLNDAVTVVRKFESVFLPQAPSAYLQLSGLLELFSNTFRILAHVPQSSSSSSSSSSLPKDGSSTAPVPVPGIAEQEWEFILKAVSLAALHIYRIKSSYNRDWVTASPDFYYCVGDLNVGPATDPLRVLTLNALFQRAQCSTYIDAQNGGRDRLYLKTATTWLLSAQMLPADRERTMLVEALEDAFAAWAQLANTANRHRHLSLSEQMEAHAEITSDMLIDLFGSSKSLHIAPPGFEVEADDNTAAISAEKRLEQTLFEVYSTDSACQRPPTVTQLIGRMPHGTAVPQNSLLWRLSEIVLVSTAKRSADFWGAPSIMTFLRLLWAMALKEIRWRWENSKPIPRIPALAEYLTAGEEAVSGAETPIHSSGGINEQDKNTQSATAQFGVHLKYALVHQKLEMLNCCLERKLIAEGISVQATPSPDDTAFKIASSTPEEKQSNSYLDAFNTSPDNDGLAQRIRAHVKEQIRKRIGDSGAELGQRAWAQGSRIRRPLGRLLTSMRTQQTRDSGAMQSAAGDTDEFEEIKVDTYDSDSDGFVSAEDVDYEDVDDSPIGESECESDKAHSPASPMRLPANAVRSGVGCDPSNLDPHIANQNAKEQSSAYVDVAIASSLDSTSGFHHVSDVYEREKPSVMSGGSESTTSPAAKRTSSAETDTINTKSTQSTKDIAKEFSADALLSQEEREGGLYPLETLQLLETCEPMWIPKIQMHPVLTEDMLREREAILMSFGTSNEGAQQRAQLQCAELISDMESFKAANPGCVLADFVRWHSPRDWIVPEGGSESEGSLSVRMSGGGEGNLWHQLWAGARRLPADKQKPLFDYEMEAEKALHYLEGIPVYSLFSNLLPAVFLISYERLFKQPVIHRIGCLRKRLADLGNKIALKVDWSAIDPESSVYSSIMDDLEELEVQTSRCVSLLYKFPKQYQLVEVLVENGQAIVDDRNVQKAVLKALSTHSNILAASPARREYAFSADLPGISSTDSDTQQRMHAVIEDDKTMRVVYGRAKVQGTASCLPR